MAQSKSKSKGRSADGWQSYSPTMFEAPQRSVLQEGREGIQVMEEAYPRILALNERFGSAFARNEVDTAAARSAAESAAMRSQYPAFRESMLASPEVARANQALQARMDELGPSDIERELNQQALSELRMGGALSPEEQRAASQSARAAYSARGLATGSPAAVAEVLARDSFGRQRMQERRAFAGAVDAQRTARRSADAASANNLFNTTTAFWDPQLRLFGRGGSQVSGQVSGASSFAPFLGAAQQVGQGNQAAVLQTNALNQAGEQFGRERDDSYWYTLFNAQQTNANAAAQRRSNTLGAGIGGVASIGAAGLMAFSPLSFL